MAQTLEVMVLDGASYRLMAVHDDVVEAVPFDGVPLKLARPASR